MKEGTSDEVASIGWLSRVELRGREYKLQYHFDPEIPRLTNADVYALASLRQHFHSAMVGYELC